MAEELSQPPAAPSEDLSQAPAATPPVAASSAADAPTPPNQPTTVAAPEDATTRGRVADVAAYNKELEDYLAGRLQQQPDPPAPPSQEPDPAGAGLEPTAPPAEPAPATPPPTTPDPDDDPALPPDGSLPKNLKMKVQNAFDFEVMTLRKRGYDWADAQEMAAKRYPESAEAKALAARQPNGNGSHPPAATEDDGKMPSLQPRTLAELDAALEAADKAYNAAVLNYDEDGMNAARAEQRKLTGLRADIAEAERRNAASTQETFNQEFNDYLAQAEALYPAAKDPESPLSQRAAAIQAQLGRDGSPLYSLPESALIVFQRAAKELGVQPTPQAPSPAPPASPPPQAATPAPQPSSRPRNPGAVLIAGGNARTQQPGPAPEVDFSKMTRKQYDAHLEKYLQTSAA